MFNVQQLKELIIKPALIDLIMFSEDAMQLLVFTCSVESLGGTYLKQIKGPALGIYQMEPENYNDIWQNYIKNKNNLSLLLATNFDCSRMPHEDRLVYDLRFATAMTRIHYARVAESLPPSNNPEMIYNYYKKNYNSSQGAATQDKSIDKYLSFINN
jgi:hypothetical protein